jgi:hypothetical protein
MTTTQSVEVTNLAPPKTPYIRTFTSAQLNDPATCCPMFTTTGDPMTSFTGTLAAVLVYSDPAGIVMPADRGPLRFFVADSVPETLMTGSYSVGTVNQLNVVTP